MAAASFRRRPVTVTRLRVIDCRVLSYLRPGSSAASGFRHRAMVVAMSAVRIMEMSLDQIVNMVSMRNCFMSTVRPMHML
jgi:hypothetical protein